MANYAFFISETYLKNNSPMGENVDIKEIYPYARSAEDVYIQEAIGTALYDRLIAAVSGSPSTLTTDETVLVKKIRSAMVWWTCYDALPFIWVKLRNIGLVKQSGENLETVAMDEMEKIENKLKSRATFYTNRLKDYLCENSNLFAEYNDGCWNCGDLSADGTKKNSTDLFFDRNGKDYEDTKFYKKYIRE
jgi:hypothetical protein